MRAVSARADETATCPRAWVRGTKTKPDRQVFWLTARSDPRATFPRAARHRAEVASGSSFWPITAAALRRIHTGFPLRRTRSHGRNLSRRQRCYPSPGGKARSTGRLTEPLKLNPPLRDVGRLGGHPSTTPPCDRRRLRRRAERTQLKRAWESFRNSSYSTRGNVTPRWCMYLPLRSAYETSQGDSPLRTRPTACATFVGADHGRQPMSCYRKYNHPYPTRALAKPVRFTSVHALASRGRPASGFPGRDGQITRMSRAVGFASFVWARTKLLGGMVQTGPCRSTKLAELNIIRSYYSTRGRS